MRHEGLAPKNSFLIFYFWLSLAKAIEKFREKIEKNNSVHCGGLLLAWSI